MFLATVLLCFCNCAIMFSQLRYYVLTTALYVLTTVLLRHNNRAITS